MIDVTTTIEIARPTDEVFAFVADQTNAPRWQTGLHGVRRLTPGPIGVGSEHEFARRFAGREMTSRNRFVEFEPGRFVAFEIPNGWITGTASYLTEAGPSGGTLLTSRMRLRLRRPASVLEPILGWLLARDSRRDEARLKRLLERGDADDSARHPA